MAKKKAANSPSTDQAAGAAVAPTPPAPRKFQSFERMTAQRSSLVFHETNPRTIDQHAFKKLRDFIKKRGLLNALVVNRRTVANGFPPDQDGRLVIVGGHQRCRAMDEIVGYPGKPGSDYQLPIDLICVEPGRESEIIVALNNPGMQGSWDFDLLADLLTTPGVDPLATGFDRTELASFLDAGVIEQILGTAAGTQIRAEGPILDAMGEIAAAGTAANQAANQAARQVTFTAGGGVAQPNSPAGQAANISPAEAREAEIQGMKDRRKAFRESANSDANQAEFYFVLVGDSDAQIQRLLRNLGLPTDQQFYPLGDFLERIGYDELDDGGGSPPDFYAGPSDPSESATSEIDETIAGAFQSEQ